MRRPVTRTRAREPARKRAKSVVTRVRRNPKWSPRATAALRQRTAPATSGKADRRTTTSPLPPLQSTTIDRGKAPSGTPNPITTTAAHPPQTTTDIRGDQDRLRGTDDTSRTGEEEHPPPTDRDTTRSLLPDDGAGAPPHGAGARHHPREEQGGSLLFITHPTPEADASGLARRTTTVGLGAAQTQGRDHHRGRSLRTGPGPLQPGEKLGYRGRETTPWRR